MSRDQADIAVIFKRLRFHDIGIITVEEGEINAMHIGFKWVMNEAYVESCRTRPVEGSRGG